MANDIICGMGFHHVALKTSDLRKSIEMYKALGMKEFARWGKGEDEIVMLDVGDGGKIEFFANGGDRFSVNGKWQHFALKVDDVETAYNTAIKAGFGSKMVPTVIPLDSKPVKLGIHIAFVIGPDGEEVELFKEL